MSYETLLIVIGLVVLFGGGYALIALTKSIRDLKSQKDESQNLIVVNLNQRVDDLSKNVSESLQKVTDLLLRQLGENTKTVDARLEATNRTRQQSEQEIQKMIREVSQKLAQVEEANKKIFDVGKNISSLQEILRAPKLRGTLGELMLDELLGQVFPANRYKLQYAFKSGESVDAVVLLRDGHIVPIDSKFPLESFQRVLIAETDEAKKLAHREFITSAKKRIDEIASKYIVPDEGTLSFALMYIPAENVYYETIIKSDDGSDLMQYAYAKKVIPVSPNNLYVYLQTIALGLRGMQIEERAREILQDLGRLHHEFQRVTESYDVLGKHISNASAKYEETARFLGKFGDRVEQIESKTDPEVKEIEG